MTRRIWTILSVLLIAAMALTACITPTAPPAAAPAAEGGDQAAAAPAAEGEPIELLYMTHNHAPVDPRQRGDHRRV